MPMLDKLTLVVEGHRQDFWYPTSMRLDSGAMAGLRSLTIRAFLAEHQLPAGVEPQLIWDPWYCGDGTCPCQDGDWCHYVDDPETGTPAMKR